MRVLWRVVLGVALLTVAAAAPVAAAARLNTVPSGFIGNSVTWLSANQGWVMGSASCGSNTCTDVLASTNGGKTWNLTGKVPAPIEAPAYPAFGVTEIRFATPTIGWAFNPDLVLTTNGGKTWKTQPIPGGAHHVVALATSATTTYVVVSSCKFNTGGSCHKPLTFLRHAVSGGPWTKIAVSLPMNLTAGISLLGTSVYVWDEQLDFGGGPDKIYASQDGTHFTARKSPCSHAQDVAITDVEPVSATKVDMLCVGNPGFSKAVKTVYRSANTGKTDQYAGILGLYGLQSEMAVSHSGNIAVASFSDGSFMDINDNNGQKWNRVIASGDGGAGWNDIQYVTNSEAWVMYAPEEYPAQIGKLYVTHDAGHHWKLSPYSNTLP